MESLSAGMHRSTVSCSGGFAIKGAVIFASVYTIYGNIKSRLEGVCHSTRGDMNDRYTIASASSEQWNKDTFDLLGKLSDFLLHLLTPKVCLLMKNRRADAVSIHCVAVFKFTLYFCKTKLSRRCWSHLKKGFQ